MSKKDENKGKVTTLSIAPEVHERGLNIAKKMFGKKNVFSTYVAYLINKDCDERDNSK